MPSCYNYLHLLIAVKSKATMKIKTAANINAAVYPRYCEERLSSLAQFSFLLYDDKEDLLTVKSNFNCLILLSTSVDILFADTQGHTQNLRENVDTSTLVVSRSV